MKILLILCLAMAPAFAVADDLSATIQREATKCAKALLGADFDAVVTYTHKRVIDGMGGKAAMVATMKRGLEDMRTQGVSFEDATVGDPKEPQTIEGWLVTLLPQRLVMKVPGGHLEQESHLLGISEDDGEKWVFVDVGAISAAQFAQVFPEPPERLSCRHESGPRSGKMSSAVQLSEGSRNNFELGVARLVVPLLTERPTFQANRSQAGSYIGKGRHTGPDQRSSAWISGCPRQARRERRPYILKRTHAGSTGSPQAPVDVARAVPVEA